VLSREGEKGGVANDCTDHACCASNSKDAAEHSVGRAIIARIVRHIVQHKNRPASEKYSSSETCAYADRGGVNIPMRKVDDGRTKHRKTSTHPRKFR
jgi:hypothetical protein